MAVVVALCASMLFGVAALAVDLGNAWARKRDLQTQVDLAALAGGSLLPRGDAANQTAIATEVATYLNRNRVSSDQPVVGPGDLLDGVAGNGEIDFPTDTQLRLAAPTSRVDFGLATAIGYDGRALTSTATVEKRALIPDLDDVLPMWLPSTCVYGPVGGDTGPSSPPTSSPTYNPKAGTNRSGTFTVDNKLRVVSMDVTTAPYGSVPGTVKVTLENTSNNPLGSATTPLKGAIVLTFGEPTSWVTADTVYPVNLVIAKNGGTQEVTVPTMGLEVTDTVGTWQAWAVYNTVSDVVTPGMTVFSTNALDFVVTGGGGEVACDESQRGNFGQLDSPRTGVGQLQRRYEYNLALGLDHTLAPFEPSSYPLIETDPECFTDGNPQGARIDNQVRSGNNCIYVQSGNDPGGLTAGLLTGVSGGPEGAHPGRLFSAPTSPLCLANGRAAPVKPNDSKVPWASINRDTLSCFLKDGYTLADIARDGTASDLLDILDPAILDSPRYFQVPVVYSLDRADKKYIAIKTYASVFLTDETTTSAATADNGVVMNAGGTQVFSVQVFGFNGWAIPIPPNNPDTEWYEGGVPVIRLVD